MYDKVLARLPNYLECLNFPMVSWCRVKEDIRLQAMAVPSCGGFSKASLTDEAPPSSSLLRPVHYLSDMHSIALQSQSNKLIRNRQIRARWGLWVSRCLFYSFL